MSKLLSELIEAHGGHSLWSKIEHVEASASVRGGLWARKGWPDALIDTHVRIETRRQVTTYAPFVEEGQTSYFSTERVAVLSGGRVLQERSNPREAFNGHSVPTPWDLLHLAYFSGYAMWNYLAAPFMFAYPGISTEEIDPWNDGSTGYRRLKVTFPESFATHCPVQTFHVGQDGLLTRMDYEAVVTGGMPTAHVMSEYKKFDGIMVPTRRRALARRSDGTADAERVGVLIDLRDIAFS
jgi:hypothetical protein